MDDLDELLMPADGESTAQDAVWKSTTRVLRNRRWARRARHGVVMLLCFVAGMAAIHWTKRPDLFVKEVAVVEPPKSEPPKEAVDPYRNDSPKSLERWAAQAEGDKRSNLYRRAGDGYLERGNEIAAIRCYKSALNGISDLAVRPDQDTWLMMSMKLARQKEKPDASN